MSIIILDLDGNMSPWDISFIMETLEHRKVIEQRMPDRLWIQ